MKALLILFSLFSLNALGESTNYYPGDLTQKIEQGLKDQQLKDALFLHLHKNHRSVGYNEAKRQLFGKLHLKKGNNGYFVFDVYCRKEFKSGVGPGSIPDQNKLNCEHTWPQSKFTTQFPEQIQKSDLHHLFPTDSRANSTRGNYNFADVTQNKNLDTTNCNASKSGPSVLSGGDHFFEPPKEHKGNVARALFYFSVKYKMPINDKEEEFLRRWNDLDPVDEEERERNSAIADIQRSRNPFIDFENLADQIANF